MTDTLNDVQGFVTVRPASVVNPAPLAAVNVSPAAKSLLNGYNSNNNKRLNGTLVSNNNSPEKDNVEKIPKRSKKSHREDVEEPNFSMISCLPESLIPSYFVGTQPELFVIQLRGGLELIYCNQGSNEGFLQPLISALFQVSPGDQSGIQIRNNLCKKTKILCAVPRRESREENTPQLKTSESNGSVKYKKLYFVRYPGITANGGGSRRQALETIAQVRF